MSLQGQRMRVLAAGICSLLLALGIARFAYTPLLPVMQAQAGLGLAEGGWLAALNYAGYLCGALIASLIGDLRLKDRLYRIGMLVAVLSTLLMGLADDFVLWAVSRFFAGLSSAASMLLGTGLILNWLLRHNLRGELGIHFSGVGLGIIGCTLAVAAMSALDWQTQWFDSSVDTGSYRWHVRWIGLGQAPNYEGYFFAHWTVNANGEVVVDWEEGEFFVIQCPA